MRTTSEQAAPTLRQVCRQIGGLGRHFTDAQIFCKTQSDTVGHEKSTLPSRSHLANSRGGGRRVRSRVFERLDYFGSGQQLFFFGGYGSAFSGALQ